jgi:hypothetical protein
MAKGMTEEEWNASSRPGAMLAYLVRVSYDLSPRKMHLFGSACCRRVWHLLQDPRSHRAVEVAERYADGLASRKELASARQDALAAWRTPRAAATEMGLELAARAAARCAASNGREAGRSASQDAAKAVGNTAYFGTGGAATHPIDFWHHTIALEEEEQARLFRDIIGPLPFRPVTIEPSLLRWSDSTALRLAEGVYEEKAFDRMGILADALTDAGCDNEEALAHCREQGALHTRGCWVLDLLLGKS